MFGAVQFLNVLILTLCVPLFNTVKLTELPPVGKELLTRLIICYFVVSLFIFPFDVWDKLWVLIRSVPVVSLPVLFSSRTITLFFVSANTNTVDLYRDTLNANLSKQKSTA